MHDAVFVTVDVVVKSSCWYFKHYLEGSTPRVLAASKYIACQKIIKRKYKIAWQWCQEERLLQQLPHKICQKEEENIQWKKSRALREFWKH